ncbi:MAG: hypothetical protein NY202_04795 [Mollicutes bacterium UO1]
MTKITKQEFENYSNQFLSTFVRLMNTSEFKSDSEDEQEMFGLLLSQIKSGNIFALCISCEMVEFSLKEDFSAIKNRAKEHIVARGYYNPASPLTLSEFRARRKKLGCENFEEL